MHSLDVAPTEVLGEQINNAIQCLLPLFKVTTREFEHFLEPNIRRFLECNEYPEHDRKIPAYSSIDNFIYFPLTSSGNRCDIFHTNIVFHETSHYIHSQINPNIKKYAMQYLNKRNPPVGFHDLIELVAEYPNFILGIIHPDFDEDLFANAYGSSKRIFDTNGPTLLPKLARMTLQEAIQTKLIIPNFLQRQK